MAGDRITKDESNRRIQKCYDFRFNNTNEFKYTDWVKYAKETYNDKSEQQYTYYWTKAGDLYKDQWKEKLNKQLDPAVNELIRLLSDENPKIRHEAAKSIFKYTGEEVQKIEANVTGEIKVKFG